MKQWFLIFFVLMAGLTSGCASNQGKSVSQQRQSIENMRAETLNTLYRQKPYAADTIERSAGYAVFSNANVNLIFASAGGGYGVVHSNAGKVTYMKMGELGVGLGAGVKDFRLVMVFHTPAAMQRFIEHGWAFGAQADAAAKAGDKGGAVGAEASVDDVTIYQFTEAGLALQATLKGTKFWVDKDLN